MLKKIEPSILYMGTPVVLVSTVNEDGSYNLAPMSSAFWLGWRCMLGFEAVSQTPQNLVRTGECVLNLPSSKQVDHVNKLSMYTGSNPVPAGKTLRGYKHYKDKFGIADLTPVPSETVAPPRAAECPVQMEAVVANVHRVMADDYDYSVHPETEDCTLEGITCVEVRIQRVWVDDSIVMDGSKNHIDPDLWKPLIMSFCRYYGLGNELAESKLAKIPEIQYRSPDIDRARLAGAPLQREPRVSAK